MLDSHELAFEALADRVGQLIAAVDENVVEPAVDDAGRRLDRLESAPHRPATSLKEESTRPALGLERPKATQLLLDGPGTRSPEITSSEEPKLGPAGVMDFRF